MDGAEGQQNPIGGQEDGFALRDRVATAIRSGEDLSDAAFDALALAAFRLQFAANPQYGRWCRHIGWTAERVARLERVSEIPCLPVEAFKWGDVHTAGTEEEGVDPVCFRTSGTTSDTNLRGVHIVRTPGLYRLSARSGFERVYGPPSEDGAVVLGLLPGYLERSDSSLVHMVEDLREAGWALPGESPADGFHLHDVEGLFRAIDRSVAQGRKPVVIGVTWALVDAADAWASLGRGPLPDTVSIVETGGMKGRRKEWVREEVHAHLQAGFGCDAIAGEYGMTELLSQAWSTGGGQYETPPWMRVRIRRTDDPFSTESGGSTGGLDLVDLANLGSCCFLSSQDLARPLPGAPGRQFEVLGRFDHAEVRGCNLMVE